jgi:hypothetical protein
MTETTDFVTFQDIEHSGDFAIVHSWPAIITSRRMQAVYAKDGDGLTIREIAENGQEHDKVASEVEVYNLTVFLDGAIEFMKDVYPYTDDLGWLPSSHSYRAVGSEAPKIDLKKRNEELARRQADPNYKPEHDTLVYNEDGTLRRGPTDTVVRRRTVNADGTVNEEVDNENVVVVKEPGSTFAPTRTLGGD